VSNANSKHGGGSHDDYATSVYPGGKPNPNVYDPSKTYPANDKKWGDIIAFTDVSGNALTGSAQNVAGLNNTGIGALIFNGTGNYAGLCKALSARDYYETERAAGIPPADILNEMNELDAPEFADELSACGGTFTGCDPSKLGTPKGAVLPPGVTLTPGKGALNVKIWIDKNRNGSQSTAEKNLPKVKVTIEGPGGVKKTSETDANGNVLFTELDPGSWKVVSTLDLPGYEKVYDADGAVDWATSLSVVEGGIAETSFAAAAQTLPETGTSTMWLATFAGLMMLAGFAVKRRIVS
jgi:LPXTG-motif cell wall-anchored protein